MTYTTRIAEAKSEAREEGIRQGTQQAKLETAKTLLAFGDSIEKVSKVTGLSVEEIEKL
jgi:predicted transposase/invertase (TIGR01784 family)